MSRGRRSLLGVGVFAAGVVAGAVAEELLFRRAFRDEHDDVLDRPAGTPLRVESFDGTELYAEAWGEPGRPSIVLAHGFTLSHVVWHHQLIDLARDGRFRVLAYDARGHGRSGPATGPDGTTAFDPETLARDLFAVIHGAGMGPTVVVGHSMGGMTIQSFLEYADTYPEDVGPHVRGLVLLNTTFTALLGAWHPDKQRFARVRRPLERAVERLAAEPRLVDRIRLPVSDLALLATRFGFGSRPARHHVELTRRLIEATPSETIAAAMTGLGNFDTHARLEKIDVPVLICAGTRDMITPSFLSREMCDRIPDCELVLFDGVGHMAMLERPGEVSAAIRSFAERVLS